MSYEMKKDAAMKQKQVPAILQQAPAADVLPLPGTREPTVEATLSLPEATLPLPSIEEQLWADRHKLRHLYHHLGYRTGVLARMYGLSWDDMKRWCDQNGIYKKSEDVNESL